MDVADIISDYGANYIDAGQNAQRMNRALMYENDFDIHFTVRESDDTVYRTATSSLSRVVQPFQTGWTPTGEVSFSPEPIQLYELKVDFQDYPHELEKSWLGFLASNNHDPAQWPFTRWLIENHLRDQVVEDIILNEAYAGEYAAPTPGTEGAAGTAMNGLKKIINDHIDASKISPFTIGAWDTVPADFVDQIEADFINQIDIRDRRRSNLKVMMNIDLFTRYQEGMIAKYNMSYDQAQINRSRLYPNIEFVGTEALGTSEKIWATTMENQVCTWKYGSKQGQFGIEGEDRLVKIWTDFWKGYGFLNPGRVYTNDLDLNTP